MKDNKPTVPIELKCPYCNNVFGRLLELQTRYDYEFIECDTEETHGCGKIFVVKADMKISHNTYKLELKEQK